MHHSNNGDIIMCSCSGMFLSPYLSAILLSRYDLGGHPVGCTNQGLSARTIGSDPGTETKV